MTDKKLLVLASGSPRRREILGQLGLGFHLQPSGADEPPFAGGSPAQYAADLAALKAEQVLESGVPGDCWVLGADTIVVQGARVFGKPTDDEDAQAMLSCLQNAEHQVITAVALRHRTEPKRDFFEATRVWFRPLTLQAIARYVASGEGRDKAGSYGIQELGAGLVTRVEGSYSNVVGLPAAQTASALVEVGVLSQWP